MSSSVTVSDVARAVLPTYQPAPLWQSFCLSYVMRKDLPSYQLASPLLKHLDTNSLLLRDNALCIRDSYALCQESRANGDAVGR